MIQWSLLILFVWSVLECRARLTCEIKYGQNRMMYNVSNAAAFGITLTPGTSIDFMQVFHCTCPTSNVSHLIRIRGRPYMTSYKYDVIQIWHPLSHPTSLFETKVSVILAQNNWPPSSKAVTSFVDDPHTFLKLCILAQAKCLADLSGKWTQARCYQLFYIKFKRDFSKTEHSGTGQISGLFEQNVFWPLECANVPLNNPNCHTTTMFVSYLNIWQLAPPPHCVNIHFFKFGGTNQPSF